MLSVSSAILGIEAEYQMDFFCCCGCCLFYQSLFVATTIFDKPKCWCNTVVHPFSTRWYLRIIVILHSFWASNAAWRGDSSAFYNLYVNILQKYWSGWTWKLMKKSVDTLFYLKILVSLGGKIYQKSHSQHYFQIRK